MRIKHIYITKEGEPMANPEMEYPEKPQTGDDRFDWAVFYADWAVFYTEEKKYHSGLLPFEDREIVERLLPNDAFEFSPSTGNPFGGGYRLKPDTLIPVDLEVEVVEVCQIACQSPCDSYNDTGHCKNPKIFLRIKP